MGDYYWAQIQIGGKIPQSSVAGLVDAFVVDTNEIKDENDLMETMTGSGIITVVDESAHNGQFDTVERFCVENGIAFDRENAGYCEYAPEQVYFRPGMSQPHEELMSAGGENMVFVHQLEDVKKALEAGDASAALKCLEETLPPTFDTLDPVEIVGDIIPCTFVSQWDGNNRIYAAAKYDSGTGEVVEVESVDIDGLDCLEGEWLEFEGGDEIHVCDTCHNYTLKTVMEERPAGSGALEEVQVCSDPECDSHN